jgi:hypothetical protein
MYVLCGTCGNVCVVDPEFLPVSRNSSRYRNNPVPVKTLIRRLKINPVPEMECVVRNNSVPVNGTGINDAINLIPLIWQFPVNGSGIRIIRLTLNPV